MASIQYSGIGITQMSNKLGNSVFTRNKSGQIARAYVIPANTLTIPRVNARDCFANACSLWNGITSDEFTQWQLFAKRFVRTNNIAKRYQPTARNIFIECNMNLLMCFLLPISSPVFNELTHPILSLQVNSLSPTVISVTPIFKSGTSIIPANHVLSISASPSVSTGINYPKNFFLQVLTLPEFTDVSSVDFILDYLNFFTIPVTGQKMFFKISLVNELTGIRSKNIICSTIVS